MKSGKFPSVHSIVNGYHTSTIGGWRCGNGLGDVGSGMCAPTASKFKVLGSSPLQPHDKIAIVARPLSAKDGTWWQGWRTVRSVLSSCTRSCVGGPRRLHAGSLHMYRRLFQERRTHQATTLFGDSRRLARAGMSSPEGSGPVKVPQQRKHVLRHQREAAQPKAGARRILQIARAHALLSNHLILALHGPRLPI